jgi:hypothetical protein
MMSREHEERKQGALRVDSTNPNTVLIWFWATKSCAE